VEDVNASIQKRLTENCPESIADLAIKAIAFAEQQGSPAAVAELLKPIIRKLASGGGTKR
jgi:hypothetical protein